jgi:hypothetical protein
MRNYISTGFELPTSEDVTIFQKIKIGFNGVIGQPRCVEPPMIFILLIGSGSSILIP